MLLAQLDRRSHQVPDDVRQSDAARGSASFGAVVDPCNRNLLVLRTSYGFGIRWFSPLGPLRFEWGFPFKPLPYEDSSVFEFTIGNFF